MSGDNKNLKYLNDEKVLENMKEYKAGNVKSVSEIVEDKAFIKKKNYFISKKNSNSDIIKNDINKKEKTIAIYENEKYLEAYVGENYSIIKQNLNQFSRPCFYFSEFYLLYRKYYPSVLALFLTNIISM